jgi:predicted metalloprotease with PDZ domain
VHVGMGLSARRGADWIVEGFAEFYALEALRRSGTVNQRRFDIAHEELAEWGSETSDLCGRSSSGSRTARAVMVLAELDAEIRDETDGRSSLDDVLAELAELDRDITVERFREIAAEVAGEPVEALENLPGCSAA